MRIFISYRRRDSGYLAYLIRTSLPELLPAASIVVDLESFNAGASTTTEIESRIASCDSMLVLIGPHWEPERLNDGTDFVRREILIAYARRQRIIPILHGEAALPQAQALPTSLAWIPDLSALSFGHAFRIKSDMAMLAHELTKGGSQFKELREQASDLYERGDLVGLEGLVQDLWTNNFDKPNQGTAETYRLMALALQRAGRSAERIPWLARAMSAAFMSGANHTFALLLLPLFFQSLEVGRNDDARATLVEIARLTSAEDATQVPPRDVVMRAYLEKMATSYYLDADYARAKAFYSSAADACISDDRGRLKAAAGVALCEWHLGLDEKAIKSTREIMFFAAGQGWKDIEEAARANHLSMTSNHGTFQLYEVL